MSFFFNDTATTEIYTLSLHDALPISQQPGRRRGVVHVGGQTVDQAHRAERRREGDHEQHPACRGQPDQHPGRSEEHTSELQSRQYLVCRLLLEKKKTNYTATGSSRIL